MSTETDIVPLLKQLVGGATLYDERTGARIGNAYELAVAEITKLRAERDAAAREMRERCMAAVESLRVRDATNFKDAHCQGQRGMDRTDAFYDAYHAIRTLPAVIATDRETPNG